MTARYEHDIVAGFRHGEEASFSAVYDLYYEKLLFFARKLVPLETAEDLLAEAFVKLWGVTAQFNSLPQIEQWLRVTIKNSGIDHLRKEKRIEKNKADLSYLTEQQYEDLYFRSSIEAELFNRVYAEIEKLPGLTRNIIQLSFLRGLSVDDISARLQLTRQVVYNKKSLGLKALRLSVPDAELALITLCASAVLLNVHSS